MVSKTIDEGSIPSTPAKYVFADFISEVVWTRVRFPPSPQGNILYGDDQVFDRLWNDKRECISQINGNSVFAIAA